MKKKIYLKFTIALFLKLNVLFCQDNWLNFDGNNDYVNINSIAPSLTNLNKFTIDFWGNFPEQQNQEYAVIFSANDFSGDNRFVIRLAGSGEGNENSVVVNIIDGGQSNLIIGNTSVFDSKCHHFAYTYNLGVSQLFIDANLEGTLTKNLIFSSSDLFSLGQEFDPPNIVSQNLLGSLNEFRIWNEVLTNQEIQTYKNISMLGNELNLIELFNFNQGIANENNNSITELDNQTSASHFGTLLNFALLSDISNFILVDCCSFKQNYFSQTGIPFELFVNSINANCNNQNGSLTVEVPLIEDDYTFLWLESNLTQTSINDLDSGSYSLQITDLESCIFDTTLVVGKNLGITNIETQNVNSSCELANGTISFSDVEGGLSPYQYSINNGINYYNDSVFLALNAGTYQLKVRDLNDCVFDTIVTITTTLNPIAQFTFIQDTVFTGNPNIYVNNTSTGNNLTYDWNSVIGNPINSNEITPSFNFFGIEEGTYPIHLVVENGEGCIDSNTMFITLINKDELNISESISQNQIVTNFSDQNLSINFVNNSFLGHKVEIYNIFGKILLSNEIENEKTNVKIKDNNKNELIFIRIKDKQNNDVYFRKMML